MTVSLLENSMAKQREWKPTLNATIATSRKAGRRPSFVIVILSERDPGGKFEACNYSVDADELSYKKHLADVCSSQISNLRFPNLRSEIF